jgi:hypothetical protein
MYLNDDPDASAGLAAGFAALTLAFAALTFALYRPLFQSTRVEPAPATAVPQPGR